MPNCGQRWQQKSPRRSAAKQIRLNEDPTFSVLGKVGHPGNCGYIARDNAKAAERWSETIIEKCERIAEGPGMGRPRPDASVDLRVFPVGNYLIFYRISGAHVEIVRVLHGARDWQGLL